MGGAHGITADPMRSVIYPGTRLDRCRNSITTSETLLARSKLERERALKDPAFASEKLWEMVHRGQLDMADLSWDENGVIDRAGELAARLRYDPVIALYQRSVKIGLKEL